MHHHNPERIVVYEGIDERDIPVREMAPANETDAQADDCGCPDAWCEHVVGVPSGRSAV